MENCITRLQRKSTFCIAPNFDLALALVDQLATSFVDDPQPLTEDSVLMRWSITDESFADLAQNFVSADVKLLSIIICGGAPNSSPILNRFKLQGSQFRTIFVHSTAWVDWQEAYAITKKVLVPAGVTVLFVQCDGGVPAGPPTQQHLVISDKNWTYAPQSVNRFFDLSAKCISPATGECLLHDPVEGTMSESPLMMWVPTHCLENQMMKIKRAITYSTVYWHQIDGQDSDDEGYDDGYDDGEYADSDNGTDMPFFQDGESSYKTPEKSSMPEAGSKDGKQGKPKSLPKPNFGENLQSPQSLNDAPEQAHAHSPVYNFNNPALRKDGTHGWSVDADGQRVYVPGNAPCCDDDKDYDAKPKDQVELAPQASTEGEKEPKRDGREKNNRFRFNRSLAAKPAPKRRKPAVVVVSESKEEAEAVEETTPVPDATPEVASSSESSVSEPDSEEIHFQRDIATNFVKRDPVVLLPPGSKYVPKELTPGLKAQAAKTYAAQAQYIAIAGKSGAGYMRPLDVEPHERFKVPIVPQPVPSGETAV